MPAVTRPSAGRAKTSRWLLAAQLLLGHWAASPAAQERPGTVLEPEQLEPIVLEVRLAAEHYTVRVSEGIIVLADGETLYLPLGQLASALRLPIDVQLEERAASGWVLDEQRVFELSLDPPRLVADGEERELAAEGVLVDDDVYVRADLLASWWPVDFEELRSALWLRVSPREPLPIQLEIERSKRWSRLQPRDFGGGVARHPHQEMRHRLFGPPVIDLRLDLSADADMAGAFGSSRSSVLVASGDLLYMSMRLQLTEATLRGEADPLFYLERLDPDQGLLGPLRLSRLRVGDVFLPQQELVSGGGRGSGVYLSSFPLGVSNEFNTVTIEGEALPGWDVELLRGDQLQAARRVDASGRYLFEDVPLLPGRTELTLVFLGPFGERREETRVYNQSASLPPNGAQYWSFGLVRQEEATLSGLFSSAPDDLEEPKEDPADALAGRLRAVFDYRKGLGLRTALFAGLSSLPLEGGREHFVSLGLDRGLGRFGTVRVQAAHRLGGGWAAELGARFGGPAFSLVLNHLEAGGFTSEKLSGSLERRTEVEMRSTIETSKLRVPWDLSLVHEQPGGLKATLRTSTVLPAVRLANTLVYADDAVTGSLVVGGPKGRFDIRGSLSYELLPDLELSSVNAGLVWRRDGAIQPGVSISHDLAGDGGTTIGTGLQWAFKRNWHGMDLQFSTGFSWSDTGRASASLSVVTSFGRRTPLGHWGLQPQWGSERGRATAWVFDDRDADGRFGPGDAPIEGVSLTVDRKAATSAEGLVTLSGLPFDRWTDVAVLRQTLPDPYMIPLNEGRSVLARPGAIPLLVFPVVVTAELDGMAYIQHLDGEPEPISNVALELVDSDGEVAASSRSQFDGFWLLQGLKPGRYQLRVSPEQVARLDLAEPPVTEIELAAGEVRSGLEIVVEQRAVAAQRAAAASE